MSQINRPTPLGSGLKTHQGAPARRISAEAELRRTIASCLLWENTFYESGESIADRIRKLVNSSQVSAKFVMDLAVEAREKYQLRHAPLLLVRELLRYPGPKHGLAECIGRVIQRPDELAELVSLYWLGQDSTKKGLPRQLKRGLALAFQKFSAYSLAKYNRENAVQLRDVLFLCHAKPLKNAERQEVGTETVLSIAPAIDKPSYKRGAVQRHKTGQGKTWAELVEKRLASPDTWEVELSAGKDKAETFTRLLREGKLGYLALLRNLRNMAEAGVDEPLIRMAIRERQGGAERVLPYRFIAAARAAPQFEADLDVSMQASLQGMEKLPGQTLILVDGSGSMKDPLSKKSDLSRFDGGCGLAILARSLCEHCRVFVFSQVLKEVPPRYGMALRDALYQAAPWGSTYLGAAVEVLNQIPHDRIIVLTDEQSHDPVPNPVTKGYMLNVAAYQNGVSWPDQRTAPTWLGISGWSESSIRFIQEVERFDDQK